MLMRGPSDSRPIAWCVVGIFVGLYIFYKGFLLLQRRHLILDTPVSKVRSASLGLVEVSGLAAGPYTIVAPVSGRACYCHRTIAWEWKQRGRSKQWVKVAVETKHLPFFIDDSTGKVLVDPLGAELDLHCDFKQEFCDGFFTLAQQAPPNVENFLLRHGVTTRNKIKIEEFCIKPKNALFVLGTLDENPGLELTPQPIQDFETGAEKASSFWLPLSSSSSSSSSSPSLFAGSRRGSGLSACSFLNPQSEDERLVQAVLSPSASSSKVGATMHGATEQVIQLSSRTEPAGANDMTQQQKIAAALVKAGISNPAAWAAAGVGSSAVTTEAIAHEHPATMASNANPTPINSSPANTRQPAVASISDTAFEQRPRVVLKRGENNPTFFISWRSQREIASSLGWKCTLMIWGGPTLTIFCLWALHNMTHWF